MNKCSIINTCKNKHLFEQKRTKRKSLVPRWCWRTSVLDFFKQNINTRLARKAESWHIADMPCKVIITYFHLKNKSLIRQFIGKICKIIPFLDGKLNNLEIIGRSPSGKVLPFDGSIHPFESDTPSYIYIRPPCQYIDIMSRRA